ncbi:MAG: MmcQ/YjbR family DNA-binding protein [Bacteroidota bacterium]
MDIEQLRQYAISKPGVEEGFPFGPDALVFKAWGKMFLLMALDAQPFRFNVKCDPETAVALREEFPDHILPGYHMNKKHWNTVIANGHLSTKQLKQFIDDSYILVTSKRQALRRDKQ